MMEGCRIHTRLVIIISHYKNYRETIACVNSALQQRGEGYEIIVVDNGSNDGSGKILKKYFGNEPHVTLKKLKKNIGFARANNAGIRYARARFGAENCFICNSDVVFGPGLFEELLAAEGKGIGLISPAVFDAGHQPQTPSVNTDSPYRSVAFAWLNVLYQSLPYNLAAKIHNIRLIMKLLHPLKLLRKRLEGWQLYRRQAARAAGKTSENLAPAASGSKNGCSYRIHGCAFLLTPEFFRYYEQLYPKTYLYGEEINLSVYLKKAGLRAVIADTSPLIHKGKQSTKELYREDGRKKRLRIVRQSLLHSLPLLFLNARTIRKLF